MFFGNISPVSHLSKKDFTAESQRTQRKKFFRIPETGILKKLTSIDKYISVFARFVPMGRVSLRGRACRIVFSPFSGEKTINKTQRPLCLKRGKRTGGEFLMLNGIKENQVLMSL